MIFIYWKIFRKQKIFVNFMLVGQKWQYREKVSKNNFEFRIILGSYFRDFYFIVKMYCCRKEMMRDAILKNRK